MISAYLRCLCDAWGGAVKSHLGGQISSVWNLWARWALARLLTLALLIGGLSVVNAPTVLADTSAPQTPAEQAAASGQPVEVAADRTEYSQTFANPDGTYTLKQATAPQRARDASGGWHDIDTTLVQRADGTIGAAVCRRGCVVLGWRR